MTKYKRGDIIVVDFGFFEETGSKKRPALIISSDNYHKSQQEAGLLYPCKIFRRYKRILGKRWDDAVDD